MDNCNSVYNPYNVYFWKSPCEINKYEKCPQQIFTRTIASRNCEFSHSTLNPNNLDPIETNRNILKLIEAKKTDHYNNLMVRKQQLAKLVRAEQQQTDEEIATRNRILQENAFKEREQKMFVQRMTAEREREHFVEKKKLQQIVCSRPELRPLVSQKLLEESKMCQLMQIEDKKKINLQRCDEENIWMKVAHRVNQQQLEREEYEKQQRHVADMCVANVLRTQMKENAESIEAKRDQERREKLKNDAEVALYVHEEARQKQLKHEKLKKLAGEQIEQRKAAECVRQQKQREEMEFFQKINDLNRRQIESDKISHRDDLLQRRREAEIFLHYVRDHRAIRRMTEEEREHEITEMSRRLEAERCKKKQIYDNKRKELAQSTYSGVRRQIQDRARQRTAKQHSKLCRFMAERNEFQRREEEDRKRAAANRKDVGAYAKELLKQAEDWKRDRENEKRLELDELEKVRLEQARTDKIIKDYIERNIDILPPHPNMHLLQIL